MYIAKQDGQEKLCSSRSWGEDWRTEGVGLPALRKRYGSKWISVPRVRYDANRLQAPAPRASPSYHLHLLASLSTCVLHCVFAFARVRLRVCSCVLCDCTLAFAVAPWRFATAPWRFATAFATAFVRTSAIAFMRRRLRWRSRVHMCLRLRLCKFWR